MRRLLRSATEVCATALALVLVVSSPALAGWSEQGVPRPSGTTGDLTGVSCVTVSDCTAVGLRESPVAQLLVERWDGATWAEEPVPTSTPGSQLDAIACTASTCVAVGRVPGGASTLPLAYVRGTSGWQVTSVPVPAGAQLTQLAGVSCPTATDCTSAGSWLDGSSVRHPFVVRWDGSSWHSEAVADPAGSTWAELSGVSCPAGGVCVAVGQTTGGDGVARPLAVRRTGSSWVAQVTPMPAASGFAALYAVSCPSATACMATGENVSERWDGTAWTAIAVRTPSPRTGPAALTSVSCTSATLCAAAGSYSRDAIRTAVAETWNGKAWTLTPLPDSAPHDSNWLNAVSCAAPQRCEAVGGNLSSGFGDQPWAEAFALAFTPTVAFDLPQGTTGSATSVACPSRRDCLAVGSSPLFSQHWVGSAWISLATPNVGSSSLSGVACSGVGACTAVGGVLTGAGGTVVPTALRWNGSGWVVQSVPAPTASTRSFLLADSCPSATSCAAVGFATSTTGAERSLAASWNGTAWQLVPAPMPPGASGVRWNGVSCVSATSCVAVGSAVVGSYTAVAMVWDGSTWTLRPPTLPTGTTVSTLTSVSCTAATACTAVGGVRSSGVQAPVALRWDGSTWALQPVPSPPVTTTIGLTGVSCRTATSCVAVGFRDQSSFAARWDGVVWSPVPTDDLGAGITVLTSVSCASPTWCTAGGWGGASSSSESPLTMTYS